MIIEISEADIRHYASVTKDEAAIHLDAEAARKAGFEAPIAHGMYIMGLAQSLYMKEHRSHWIQSFSMRFEKPCVQGSTVCFRYNTWNHDQIQVTVTSDHGEIIAKGSFSVVEEIADT
ncbi:MaoC family dehydratase [Paenibacillus wynnii]|uniref:MaoC family dehydratase n=1 Tax=Paenibacillus wynnii TaxID=268407 RepID=UPI002794DA69|nr:MaoC family dehydratase [Paenibacillus wynnii]MDQ0195262.1 acyl dehydratase [Paenibacillus wynnii]